jgi:hypothetical protein
VNICERCDTAISVAGHRPAGATPEQYDNLIREVSGVVGTYPQLTGEKFQDYRIRIRMIVDHRRNRQPVPATLLRRLPDGALKAFNDGKSLSHVLLIAATPPAPRVKQIEVRKVVREEKPSRTKLW